MRRRGWRRKLVIIYHTTDIVCSFHCQIIDCYDLNEWLTIVRYNRFSPTLHFPLSPKFALFVSPFTLPVSPFLNGHHCGAETRRKSKPIYMYLSGCVSVDEKYVAQQAEKEEKRKRNKNKKKEEKNKEGLWMVYYGR